jgi:hypothetical protein
MRTKLTLLIAFILFIVCLCYVTHSKVIEVGEHDDEVHDAFIAQGYVNYVKQDYLEPDCECLACHDSWWYCVPDELIWYKKEVRR